jgi:glucan phosphoethanolaminetransferase (alkaline phosphatase superfamily)
VHLSLLVPAIAASIALPGLLRFGAGVRARRWTDYGLVLLPAAVATFVLLLYLADFASNVWMGSNVTYTLARIWLEDWRAGGDMLALSRWVGVSLALLVAAVFAAHLAAAHWFAGQIDALLRPSLTTRQALRRGACATAIVIAYGLYLHHLSWRTPRSELLTSDPILAFLRSSIDIYDDSYLALAERLKAEEPRCRAAAAAPRPFDRRNVILIIVDSLRADHLSLYGYGRPTTPFLDALAAAGRLRKVDFATSTCAESNCGILSTLASKTLRRQIAGDFKLPDLLHDQGYKTFFVLSGSHDWHGLRDLYGTEQTLYFEGRDSRRYGRSDDRLLFEGLERVPDAGGPAFFYFHLMSAHLVGTKQDQYKIYRPSNVSNDWAALFNGAYDRESVVNNYDNGVTQADATIRELFASLERKGYLRGSVVVILGDHGEGLGERGPSNYGHVTSLYQEFIRIPLLVYDDPGVRYDNLQFATQIDVAPTIADRLGLPVPSCWDGHSLYRGPIAPLTVHQTTLKRPAYALVYRHDGRIYKYMYSYPGRREEIYDLTADPRERTNLRDTVDPALLAFFRGALERARTD